MEDLEIMMGFKNIKPAISAIALETILLAEVADGSEK